jgi:predicted metal-dependent HD superfamily phosphohydrolase
MPRCHHRASSIKIVTAPDTDTLEAMTAQLELSVAWQRHVASGAAADHWLETVTAMYRQPGRHYHDVRHLAWVVRHITAICAEHPADDAGAVVAAAFFHDAVYDPTRHDNEAQSAALAERALTELGWAPARISAVAAMVLATIDHDVATADADTQIVLAADLAVLAADPAPYGDYARAVRKEYAHVGDEAWRTGRRAVLRSLLDRQHLFAPRLGLARWEQRARANITSELATLGA